MDTLALTDRDGAYGAVKFAKACLRPGPPGPRRRPRGRPHGTAAATEPRACAVAHAGAGRAFRTSDCPGPPSWPRGSGAGPRSAGWSRPPTSPASAAARWRPWTWSPSTSPARTCWSCSAPAPSSAGPDAAPGRPGPRRPAALAGDGRRSELLVEVVSHRLAGSVRAPRRTPRGWPGWPADGLGVVLTNAVRYADRADAHRRRPRRAAAWSARPASRRPRQRRGVLEVRQGDGRGRRGDLPVRRPRRQHDREARRLLTRTRWSPTAAPSTRAPTSVSGGALPGVRLSGAGPAARRRPPPTGCCRRAARPRSVTATATRPAADLEAPRRRAPGDRGLGYASYFLTVADVTDLIREMGVRCAARGSGAGQPGQLPARVSGVDPLRTGC